MIGAQNVQKTIQLLTWILRSVLTQIRCLHEKSHPSQAFLIQIVFVDIGFQNDWCKNFQETIATHDLDYYLIRADSYETAFSITIFVVDIEFQNEWLT